MGSSDRSRRDRSVAARGLDDLVGAAARGDPRAQAELFEKYGPLIRATVRARKRRLGQLLAGRADTADLEQEAALSVLSGLAGHRFQSAVSFTAWVKRLAEHAVVDQARHHGAQKRRRLAEASPSSLDSVAPTRRDMASRIDAGRDTEALWRQVEALKPDYAAALIMHHLGFTHAEIGDNLGVSEEAARKLVTRARTKLLEARR